jgi:hypothetical protein
MDMDMTVEELVEYIGSRKVLRVERWRDEHKHWRAGIEWFSEDRYEYVCEMPTLKECLMKIYDHLAVHGAERGPDHKTRMNATRQ